MFERDTTHFGLLGFMSPFGDVAVNPGFLKGLGARGSSPIVRVVVPDDGNKAKGSSNVTDTVVDITVGRSKVLGCNTRGFLDGQFIPL